MPSLLLSMWLAFTVTSSIPPGSEPQGPVVATPRKAAKGLKTESGKTEPARAPANIDVKPDGKLEPATAEHAEKPAEKVGEKADEKPELSVNHEPKASTESAGPADLMRPRRAPPLSAEPSTATSTASCEALPPSLRADALVLELANAAKVADVQKQKVAELTQERRNLDAMRAHLEEMRTGIRAEIARLEELVALAKKLPTPKAAPPPVVVESAPKVESAKPEDVARLAKAMRGMKPEKIAAMVQRLDPMLAAEVLKTMKPAEASAAFGQMKPEQAAALGTLIAGGNASQHKGSERPAAASAPK